VSQLHKAASKITLSLEHQTSEVLYETTAAVSLLVCLPMPALLAAYG